MRYRKCDLLHFLSLSLSCELYGKTRPSCHLTMKQANQQLLEVRSLDKNTFISWKNSLVTYHNNVFDWNEQEEHRIPIIESSPKSDKHQPYCFDKKKRSSKNHTIIQETPIKDYFKPSLFACLSCFWMIGGIVCLIQSIRIRQLLKENNHQLNDEARQRSNRLHTNLIFTYVVGGMIIGVLIMTILVTFVVGIKGYFSKSL
jgi:hypothetical protein